MANRIIFLGTAGDSFVAGKQLRASGGIILQAGETQLHIDPGQGAIVRAATAGINLRANTAVIVTNSRLINSNDVNAVIDSMTYGGTDKRGVLLANKTTIEGADNVRPYLTEFHKNCLEKYIVLEPGKRAGIENVEIHAIPVEEEDKNSFGLKVYTPEFVFGYSSNTKYFKDIIKGFKDCDILVLNVLKPGEEKAGYDLNSKGAEKIIGGIKPKLAILTGFGVEMLKADPMYEGREILKKTDVQVIVAKDGMVIAPGSYSAKSKQTRLKRYEVADIDDKEESTDSSSDK